MTLPKCCITCAFCYKKLYNDSRFQKSISRLISSEEAQLALDNDFSFLKKENEEFESYYKEYNKRKKEYLDKLENEENEQHKRGTLSVGLEIKKQQLQSNDINAPKILKMQPFPFGPIKEVFLCCHENCFKDIKIDNSEQYFVLTNETSCDFYFSVEHRVEKTIETCKKERDLNKQKTRDALQETRLKIELENAETMRNILSETKVTLKQTDEKIKQIITSIAQTNELTNNIANYTTRNEKASKRYFIATIIVSIFAVIVSLVSLAINTNSHYDNTFSLINIQKGIK